MKRTMEAPVPEMGGMIFPVEVSVGQSLDQMKKLHL
jgi:hypothetical protein